jgi:hypothetical protein
LITLKEWMQLADHKITEGSDYYGTYKNSDGDTVTSQLYCLDYWNGHQDGWSISIIFSPRTQEVFEVQACDFGNELAFTVMNEKYTSNSDGVAWDDVMYVPITPARYYEEVRAMREK